MLKKIIKKIDTEVQSQGISRTMLKIIENSGTEVLVVNKNKRLKKILKNHPVLIAANHPAETDVLVLLATLEKREDINLIANASLQNIIPSVDKSLIPVHIHNRLMNKPGVDRWKLRLLKKLHRTPDYSLEEEHQKNIDSINLAAKKVADGGLVAMFPGGGGDNGKWFNGIGHLISGIKNKKTAYVVRAYIEGTSNWDYMRLVPKVSKFLPKFKITFDEPTKMEEFENLDPKMITLNLETRYNSWIETIATEKRKSKIELSMISNKSFYLVRTFIFWFLAKIN